MSAHTKGPWVIYATDQSIGVKPSKAGECDICECWGEVGGYGRPRDEQEANAALIASAPDMRAALDRIEALAQEWEGMSGDKNTKYRYVAACIRGAMRGDDMAEQAEQVNLRD